MSSNEVAKPKVGQQVFLVLTLRRPIQYVTATVTKVGRVWVELDNHHRFELSGWMGRATAALAGPMSRRTRIVQRRPLTTPGLPCVTPSAHIT